MTSFWKDRPILVTGATGLVGSWLTKALVAQSADVVALVRDQVPQSELYRTGLDHTIRIVKGDVVEQDLIERALNEYEVSTVFHLAAQTIVGIANRNPVSTFESNIRGTWSLLEACRRCPTVKQIVVASSDKAYGDQPELPYREDSPLQGRHPYDCSKSCADLICTCFAETYKLPVCVTRCGNFFGGGDLNWNRIVPGTIRSLLRGQRPVIRSDGSMVRDYFYVEDGAAAYMLLAQKMAENPELIGRAYNFSNEQPISVMQIAHEVRDVLDMSADFDIRNEASHEIKAQSLCSKRARVELGWKPLFSLRQGLVSTVEWYRKYFEVRD